MKRLCALFLTLTICLAFTACDSENVKAAKQAISDGDYSKAIEYLEQDEELSKNGNYLLEEARANVAFEEKKYDEAIIHICKSKKGKNNDLYEVATQKLISTSLKSGESDAVISIANEDSDFCTLAIEKIKEACDKLNYNGFKLLDRMKTSIKDKEIRTELVEFYNENKMNKPKAFLLGRWLWDKKGEKNGTTVEVSLYKDSVLGVVKKVGDEEKPYHIKKEEVYWSDLELIDESKFTCSCLTKTLDGTCVQCIANGTIKYSKDKILMHLTPPAPFIMDSDSSERTFVKQK